MTLSDSLTVWTALQTLTYQGSKIFISNCTELTNRPKICKSLGMLCRLLLTVEVCKLTWIWYTYTYTATQIKHILTDYRSDMVASITKFASKISSGIQVDAGVSGINMFLKFVRDKSFEIFDSLSNTQRTELGKELTLHSASLNLSVQLYKEDSLITPTITNVLAKIGRHDDILPAIEAALKSINIKGLDQLDSKSTEHEINLFMDDLQHINSKLYKDLTFTTEYNLGYQIDDIKGLTVDDIQLPRFENFLIIMIVVMILLVPMINFSKKVADTINKSEKKSEKKKKLEEE